MMKPVVLAAAAVAAVGLSVAATSSAEAQYYGPGVSIHIGAPFYYGPYAHRRYRPYYAYRPYRPYYAYRPAYAYGAPYGVRYARPYAPVCARWVWRVNHYGERRRRCVAW
jgi:hypothetical protein